MTRQEFGQHMMDTILAEFQKHDPNGMAVATEKDIINKIQRWHEELNTAVRSGIDLLEFRGYEFDKEVKEAGI